MSQTAATHQVRLHRWIGTPSGRLAANVAVMGSVAAGMLWWTGSEAPQADSERVARLQAENQALKVDGQRLRDEVSDLGYQNEILHWQLRYTEQSLRQARAGLTDPMTIEPPPTRRSSTRAAEPAMAAELPTAAVVIERIDDGVADASGDDGWAESFDVLTEGVSRRLRLDDADIDVPELGPETVALARTRAYATWHEVVNEAVEGECGRHLTTAGGYKCSQNVERELSSYSGWAVSCMLSGNAVPDYVEHVDLDDLPNHSRKLERGAVIFCDGALRNQRR